MNYNNLAQKTNWIASSPVFKNVPFFLISLNIPGLSLSHPEVGGRDSLRMKLPSDTVTFNSLSFEMLVDEDFLIYQELMNIIRNNIDKDNGTFSDFYFNFFIELSNNKGNKILKLEFTNCRIESIGDIDLNAQDSATEYTLQMSIVYDYFEIENNKRYNFNYAPAVNISSDDSEVLTFYDDFSEISKDWQLWGWPLPIISFDSAAVNNQGLDSNGSIASESGAVNNIVQIDVTKPFDFTFRVKQALGADDNDSLYIEFGITEGMGIDSITNGRTGSTIMGVVVDGGSRDGQNVKTTTYKFKGAIDDVKGMYDNIGTFSDFKFVYSLDGTRAEYQIYKDGILKSSMVGNISSHNYFYLYMQGKSNAGIQIIDTITGHYSGV
jgi:hypothetical protein